MEACSVIILSERNCRKRHHVSYDTVLGMENAFLKEGAEISCFSKSIGYFNKICRKLHVSTRILDWTACKRFQGKNILFIAMGLFDLTKYQRELQMISQNNNLGIYCFDVWETMYKKYSEILKIIKPKMIFFAYKEAYLHFKKQYMSFFVPQSMDETFFYPRHIKKRRLFIQIGRKNEKIHNLIIKYLNKNNIKLDDTSYIYEKEKGKILFPSTDDLAVEIAASKYFVAAPQSCENSLLTGRVSDVTARFYEAMACKTLIIGYKPDTFDDLFPCDAMVDLNGVEEDFGNIISWYENNPKEYQRIVNRNYEYLVKYNTWRVRFLTILSAYSQIQ